mmetsp:Transcript_21376/g.24842  ORF Transcript_21376/g.24842 Transcript_21376/m.24842 type:complete len:635 (-) Transcript_21376:177-2081(-)|eukprot:CAMPEP_0176435798 /NCGR_PEP_ID=MMETSP0127-20121128/17556_1 /TAXON_ID=938130 /ORGANISM="Platyophrya macrostoma, Strain WH" /LENGTH=634 /DNA_ID=CAMNT_0017818933 /DNA_START=37 /DNA_END=1941 /DNA_ORIENTATION=+
MSNKDLKKADALNQKMDAETDDSAPIQFERIDILQTVKNSQSQNGLKHSDYNRYRRYCAKRLKRIRKSMKFTYGKGKFLKKPISLETVQEIKDPRILHVVLYNAERNWAYAQSLKQEFSNTGSKNTRLLQHVKRKLLKAQHWSKLLEKIAQQHAEKKSALEAVAYAEYMNGCYQFEIENWKVALQSFSNGRNIFSELAKISDSLQKMIYEEKIEQLEQSIRYCNHKLGLKGQGVSDLIDMKNRIHDPSLAGKIDTILDETRKQNVGGSMEIKYHGKQIPIKNEKLITLIQKIDEGINNISKQKLEKMDVEDDGDESSKFNAYIELFSNYDDAIRISNKEKEENKAIESAQQLYILLGNYFLSNKYRKVIERNRIQVGIAKSKLMKDGGIENIWTLKKSAKSRVVTPQEIVKLYDNTLQVMKQLVDLEGSNPDFKEVKTLDIQENALRLLRLFYVICTHINYGKLVEGYSLLFHWEQQYEALKNKQAEHSIQLDKVDKELAEDIASHREKIDVLKIRTHISILNQRASEKEALTKKMGDLNLEGKAIQANTLHAIIKAQLNENRTVAPEIPDNIETMQLTEFPPKLGLMSCRPFFLDLGYSYLAYPDVEKKAAEEDRQKAKSKSGIFGRFNPFSK